MTHHHHHTHDHGVDSNTNRHVLRVAFLWIAAFMVVEAIGGWLTGSLALLSDAGHMLSDALALGMALFAAYFGARATTAHNTFGYRRVEVLIAAANGLTLLAIALWIVVEALLRFRHPEEIATGGMLTIALLGLLVNLIVAWYMLKNSDTDSNINLRGAYLHVISDILGSIGAIIAALAILFFGWQWADPLASIIVAALVGRSGWQVCRQALHILMEGAPSQVDTMELLALIQAMDEVQAVHDVHVWTITSGIHALSCHIVVDGDLRVYEAERLVYRIEAALRTKGIGHATIQVESKAHPHEDALFHQMAP